MVFRFDRVGKRNGATDAASTPGHQGRPVLAVFRPFCPPRMRPFVLWRTDLFGIPPAKRGPHIPISFSSDSFPAMGWDSDRQPTGSQASNPSTSFLIIFLRAVALDSVLDHSPFSARGIFRMTQTLSG